MQANRRHPTFFANDSFGSPDRIPAPANYLDEEDQTSNKVFDPATRDTFFDIPTSAKKVSTRNVEYQRVLTFQEDINLAPINQCEEPTPLTKTKSKKSFFRQIFGLCGSKKEKKRPSTMVSLPVAQFHSELHESLVIQSKKSSVNPDQAITVKGPVDVSQFDPIKMNEPKSNNKITAQSATIYKHKQKSGRQINIDDLSYMKNIESYYPSMVNNRKLATRSEAIKESEVISVQFDNR